jgi:D-alanyl-D-alanine carboxypeptidase
MIGTSAFLNTNQHVSVYDAMYGLMLPSGNDAAIVLAESFGLYLHLSEILRKKKKEGGKKG